tara:strand:- start:106 stop:1200 length:1095 start_codon:yes stop_codon:yes gene_type:complete
MATKRKLRATKTNTKRPSLSSAGVDERKIFKSLAKLQRYPRVREIFREAASLFRRKKIKHIRNIGENRKIRELVKELDHNERTMYKKHLKGLGFPTYDDIMTHAKKAHIVVKKAPKKLASKSPELKDSVEKFKDEVEEIRDRGGTPILKVLNDHIKFLGEESFFQKAHKAAKQQNIIERSSRSVEFYSEYAANYATSFNYRRMFKEGGKKKANLMLGRMYFYKYVPNPEEVEAVFDMYPLMFILDKQDNEFEGINFHFMTPKARAVTMISLLEYLNNMEYKPSTKLIFNSLKKVIANNRRFRYAKYSYRKYRADSISSKLIEVHPLDWEIAAFCPTERFYSKQKRRLPDRYVWKQTAIRVRKRK